MKDLHNNPDITIKPADMGGSIVYGRKSSYNEHSRLFP